MIKIWKTAVITLLVISACSPAKKQTAYQEQYRPQFHFSPQEKWMNDPNGMVYHNGTYHLFYQHYPDSTIWGPMHWAHAVSKDLIHWEHRPIALFPDSLGYIFSGSAVIDSANTSGFGKDGKTPLVAIYTYHNIKGEHEGRDDFQSQALAYSLNDGETWQKYSQNPVLTSPGIRDFRDPKVMWHKPTNKWIMTLATKNRVTFYSSANLKQWNKESEFGATIGVHGGVWECPDLFALKTEEGKEVWILLVSINPGAPNGGSGTQYFIGNFDGKTFTPESAETKWIDYGTDNYAGVTWYNTGNKKLFIGWMNNWQYANKVPTQKWRGATTLPRELGIKTVNGNHFLTAVPIKAFNQLKGKETALQNLSVNGEESLSARIKSFSNRFELQFSAKELKDFELKLSNDKGEELLIGYEKRSNTYYINRTKSGKTDFEEDFAKKITAPRVAIAKNATIKLIIDEASAELFTDGGLTDMTAVFFPTEAYSSLSLKAKNLTIESLDYAPINSIWE